MYIYNPSPTNPMPSPLHPQAPRAAPSPPELPDLSRCRQTYIQYKKKREIRILDKFIFFTFFYHMWYNGLDLNRCCAPNRIIEMSNSMIF